MSRGRLVTLRLDLLKDATVAWTRSCLDELDSQVDGQSIMSKQLPSARDNGLPPGHAAIRSLSWTSDGYALAVQLDSKWALYSPFGDLVFCHRVSQPPKSDGDTSSRRQSSSPEFEKHAEENVFATGLVWQILVLT